LYKFTHKDELIYTKSTDGSINSNPGKYAAENQANEGGFQTPTDFKTIGKWKLFGRQFLSMDVMFEALFVLSKADRPDSEGGSKLRVPISCLIDYKGFRCLAVGQIPI